MTDKRAKAAHIWNRDKLDWYVEPSRCTIQLLAVETFRGPVHDPFCGGGNIVMACLEANLATTGTDIVKRRGLSLSHLGEFDALNADAPAPWRIGFDVITNPPFYRAKGLERAVTLALEHVAGKIAIFAPLPFLAGGKRARKIWGVTPPDRIWIIADRPSCPPGEFLAAGGEAKGGMEDWIWLVWNERALRRAGGPTRIGWLT